MTGLPNHVTISEVGARDGIQIEREFIPTERKIELIDALSATGLSKIEVSSFVHPKVVPQLADAEAVLGAIKRRPGVRYAAFVPNVKGAERALACGVDELKTGAAASDSFNRLNVRMTGDEFLTAIADMAGLVNGTGAVMIGVVGTAFGCPYEGDVSVDRVLRIIERYAAFGIETVHLADTTGMADPGKVQALVGRIRDEIPEPRIGLHLHNTRGLGLANALAGLELGIDEFEGSIAGLGGCPYAPRAVGNICTEDFVHMLHGMGIETDIDLDALIAAAGLAEEIVGRTLPGMVMKAGKADALHDAAAMDDR